MLFQLILTIKEFNIFLTLLNNKNLILALLEDNLIQRLKKINKNKMIKINKKTKLKILKFHKK